ncbi:unnamed protein product [Prunus armeniaca]
MGLPSEHNLYRELAITLSQTLAEVFTTAEHYGLWDDDRIDEKKSGKQVDHPLKEAIHKNDRSYNGNNLGKHKSRSIRGGSLVGKSYTEFMIPINQILNHVKDKPWLKWPPPLKTDLATRDTSKYRVFHGTHGHYTGDCKSWKRHLKELVKEGHYT